MWLDVALCAAIVVLGLLLGWCLAGKLLFPLRPGAQTVYFLTEEEPSLEREVRAVAWLRSAGLFDGMILLVLREENGPTAELARALTRRYSFVEYCMAQDWKNGW